MNVMDDIRIVDLYWARDEQAIAETDMKYGRMLRSTSYSIVRSEEDAGECLNDTYLAAWNSMPENRPQSVKGKIHALKDQKRASRAA